MDFSLPGSHGELYAHRRVPSRTAKVRTPQDLPWKMLEALVTGCLPYLQEDDQRAISACIRARSLEALSTLEDTWNPQELIRSSINPGVGFVEEFSAKYQLVGALKKYPFPGDASIRSERALKKFQAAERSCAVYNSQRRGTLDRISSTHPDLLGAADYMRDFIQRVLPCYDPIQLADELARNGRHGPGSTVCTTRGKVTPFFKWSELPYSVTAGCRALAVQAIDADPRWVGALQDWYRTKNGIPFESGINLDDFWSQVLEVVPGNVVTWVPKDRKIDRSIAIEPRMNLFLQLGMDHIIRKRLKRFGCDLDDQGKNQELARIGSQTGKYATLDLSAASDTISLAIVEELFPPIWVNALKDLRSPTGQIRSTCDTLTYSKLSSMGNGCTFAIESLVFLSTCYAALMCHKASLLGEGGFSLHDDIAVYGDDIVVPTELYGRLELLLHYCGFSVNKEKSFSKGPFRESCGADFLFGVPVRPVFFHEEVDDLPKVFSVINRCRAQKECKQNVFTSSDPYNELCIYMQKFIPQWANNLIGPPSCEEFDTYLHVPLDECHPPRKNDLYSFFRLLKVPKHSKSGSGYHDFFFRKLMALNRPVDNRYQRLPFPRNFSPKRESDMAGSVFTVTERGSLSYMLTESRTSFWF